MNEPYPSPYNDPFKKSASPLILVIAVDLIILGGAIGFYFWQQSLWDREKMRLEAEISTLQRQIVQLENEQQKDLEVAEDEVDLEIMDEPLIADAKKETTLKKTKEDNRYAYYEGSITVSGKYREYYPETLLGQTLCFYPDDETGYLIPRDPDMWGPGRGDDRIPWFCFKDQEKAKELFGINDNKVFSDQAVECIEGAATVTVSNYVVDKMESSVFDKADLDAITSKEPFAPTCKDL